ncbi:MAG: hypothetical protein FWG40_07830 [Peptococcaceae bacterium]|nr:hypothetical protein [Peptococcaceae bacterium]
MGTMGFLLAAIDQGIKTAMATGTDIPPAILNKKRTVFETINTKMVRLSNELETIANMLADDFKGVGTRECADIIRHYMVEFRCSAGIFYGEAIPPLPSDKPPLRFNAASVSAAVFKLISARDNHVDTYARLTAKTDAMDWRGEDASMARIQWNLIAGPKSNTRSIADCLDAFILIMQKSVACYSAAQETTSGPQEDPILIQTQKLRGIASWIDSVYWETLPHIEDASGLNRIAATIVPRPGQSVTSILQPSEKNRLQHITKIHLDTLRQVKTTLLHTADAFEEAERKVEAARQEFLSFCFDRPPIGSTHGDILNMTAPLTQATLATMALYDRYDCLDISFDGSAVFQYFSIDPNGVKTYNWDEIRQALAQTEPISTSPTHYAGLVKLIDSMNTTDEYGIVVPDIEALEQLINCGYTCQVSINVSTDPLTDGCVKYTYRPTQTFQSLCAFYELRTEHRVFQDPSLLYTKTESVQDRQVLLAEMTKSALLMEMISQHSNVETLQPKSPLLSYFSRFNPQTYRQEINIQDVMTLVSPGGILRVTADYKSRDYRTYYQIGSGDRCIRVHDFDFNNADLLFDNAKNITRSMKRNKKVEFWQDVSLEVIAEIVGLPLGDAGFIVSLPLFAISALENGQEIDIHNANLDTVNSNIDLVRLFGAMQAGGGVTVRDNVVTIRNICVNERELQIAVNAYNADPMTAELSMKMLVEELYVLCGTGDVGKCAHLGMYVDWYMGNRGKVDKYTVGLRDLLSDYRITHPDCLYKKLEDMTPEAINEMDKAHTNPMYNLNLEGM